MRPLNRLIFGLIVAQAATLSLAQSAAAPAVDPGTSSGPKLYWQASPFTWHYKPSDEHETVLMVGLEREHANGKIDGFTLFTNSFGQESGYLYPWGGVYHHIWGVAPLSFKWTAGFMYGYVAPYEDKVPFNYKGLSLVAIPALVYTFKSGWSAQASILGTAGMMFQVNAPLN
jgi:hypothetical protein